MSEKVNCTIAFHFLKLFARIIFFFQNKSIYNHRPTPFPIHWPWLDRKDISLSVLISIYKQWQKQYLSLTKSWVFVNWGLWREVFYNRECLYSFVTCSFQMDICRTSRNSCNDATNRNTNLKGQQVVRW